MSKQSGYAAILSAMAQRNYRIFTTGNVVSHLGTWAQRVAVGYLAWELTGSFWWLGLMSFGDLFPTVVLAPLTGAVADRVDRLRMMRMMQAFNFLQSSFLAGLTIAGFMTVELLLVLVTVGGIIVSFNQPVRLAIVPSLVPRSDLAAAIGISSMAFNFGRLVGPVIAGVLIDNAGIGTAFAFNAFTFLWFSVALTLVRIESTRPDVSRMPLRDLAGEIIVGYSYAARHKGIRPLLIILTIVALCARPYMDLLPGYADKVFGASATGLSMFYMMTGLGAILGGFWLAQRGTVRGLTTVVVTGSLGMAVSLIVFASLSNFFLALPVLAAAGFAMLVIGAGEQTLIQNAVDPELRGRVMGLYGMINRGAPALGALIMGGLASIVGPQWPVAGGAILVVVMWFWAMRRRRSMAETLEVEPAA